MNLILTQINRILLTKIWNKLIHIHKLCKQELHPTVVVVLEKLTAFKHFIPILRRKSSVWFEGSSFYLPSFSVSDSQQIFLMLGFALGWQQQGAFSVTELNFWEWKVTGGPSSASSTHSGSSEEPAIAAPGPSTLSSGVYRQLCTTPVYTYLKLFCFGLGETLSQVWFKCASILVWPHADSVPVNCNLSWCVNKL